ncbi:MAG: alanine racemase [Planctomycetota bacterium]|jgi:alanine racemase
MPRPTVARIDLDAISHNVAAIRALIGNRQICAAVKADAYGHGAPVVCHTLSAAGVDKFAVAMTEEAMDLRGAGIKKPIILLTAVPQEDIEVTTGILRISRLAGLRIEGIFSHFACSDADDLAFSRLQVRRFRSVLAQLKRAGMRLPFIHMANSNGVLRVPDAYFDGVRPGLILYGLCSRPDVHYVADLRPVLSMRTRIAHCKRVPKGEKVGYGHTFTTWRDSVLATVPVGYHDGYIRQFSNVGEMLVRGKRVPVVGRVCMDQTLADVTDVPDVQLGDEVTIYGKQGEEYISVEEMAARVDRIPYELTCAVTRRVRREFVLNGAVVVESPFRSVVPDAALGRILTTSAASSDEGLDQKPRRLGAA